MSAPSRLDFVDVILELQRQIKYFNCFNLENANNHLYRGWGNSLLAFVSLALCSVPIFFYYYGERLRTSERFKVKF